MRTISRKIFNAKLYNTHCIWHINFKGRVTVWLILRKLHWTIEAITSSTLWQAAATWDLRWKLANILHSSAGRCKILVTWSHIWNLLLPLSSQSGFGKVPKTVILDTLGSLRTTENCHLTFNWWNSLEKKLTVKIYCDGWMALCALQAWYHMESKLFLLDPRALHF